MWSVCITFLVLLSHLVGCVGKLRPHQQVCEVSTVCSHRLPLVEKAQYPVVDIFFLFMHNSATYYINHGLYWVLPKIATKFANGDVRVHIAADHDDILQTARNLSFYAHDIRPYQKEYAAFRSLIHKSVTSMEYEVTIFRWKVYHLIVSEWNQQHDKSSQVSRILCLDGDVVMTMSPAKFFDDVQTVFSRNSSAAVAAGNASTELPELINMSYGVVELFSVPGLKAFVEFIDEWYTGDEQEVIERCQKAGWKYWSDMMLLERFVSLAPPSVRNNCFEYSRMENYYRGWQEDPHSRCLVEALGCLPMSIYHEFNQYGMYFTHNGKHITTEQPAATAPAKHTLRVQGGWDHYPYCYMHFQGRERKRLMYFFGRGLEILLQADLDEEKDPNNSFLDGGLLVKREASREVFYIHRNGTREAVQSMDELSARGLSGHIITEVPMEVIQAFQLGSNLT